MNIQDIAAWAGIAAFIITMVQIPLWFIYSGPPPAKNVLARTFLALFLLPLLAVFMVGLYAVVSKVAPDYSWLALVSLLVWLASMTLTLTAHSIQVGSVLGKSKPVDPTTLGSGGEASLLIYGPTNHLLMASFIVTATIALAAADIFPDWASFASYAVALFQLSLVPTLFGKTEPAHFYSINGWNIPVSGALMLSWVLMSSIFLLLF